MKVLYSLYYVKLLNMLTTGMLSRLTCFDKIVRFNSICYALLMLPHSDILNFDIPVSDTERNRTSPC